MGKQAKETGKVVPRVRNMFKNNPGCIAVRHHGTIYLLKDAEDPEGSWEKMEFMDINQAKKESSNIQCEAAGMKPDENGHYSQRFYAHGNGAVRVLV